MAYYNRQKYQQFAYQGRPISVKVVFALEAACAQIACLFVKLIREMLIGVLVSSTREQIQDDGGIIQQLHFLLLMINITTADIFQNISQENTFFLIRK